MLEDLAPESRLRLDRRAQILWPQIREINCPPVWKYLSVQKEIGISASTEALGLPAPRPPYPPTMSCSELRDDSTPWSREIRTLYIPSMSRASPPYLAQPGDECMSDRSGVPHLIAHPDEDVELQQVLAWFRSSRVEQLMSAAVVEAVEYVLDGARTFRFDLHSPEVDSDERRTVGVKLQYRILEAFGLPKERPLDTTILGIPVELKATTGKNWQIPREGQCEISLLTQVDAREDQFRAFLMRTHRRWLNEGKNQDSKRTIRAAARDCFAVPLLEWTPLPRNPLKDLSPDQLKIVFHPGMGIKRRVTALFGFLPEVVIPRVAIETVAAMAKDPLRRARQAKLDIYQNHDLVVLMGTWTSDRELAAKHGFDLSGEAWVAIRRETLGDDFDAALSMMRRRGRAEGSGQVRPDLARDSFSQA